jgi:hypothetical protein
MERFSKSVGGIVSKRPTYRRIHGHRFPSLSMKSLSEKNRLEKNN